MRIELVNSGVAVRGVLEVEEARGGATRGVEAYAFIQRRDIFLSTHARKVVHVTVDPDTVARPLILRFTGAGRSHETTVSLRGRFTGRPLVLLLTRSNVAPAIPLSYRTPVPVVSVRQRDLPEDPRAYGGVWSVMVYEQSLRGLSRAQRGALTHWLSAGGLMVVLGGAHFALYQDAATAALLPVTVRGLKRLGALPELSARFGGNLADLLVQHAVPAKGGRVLLAEAGTPLLVEKSHGAGRVVHLALDVGRPPAADWTGLAALFGEILGEPPDRGMEPWTLWNLDVFVGLLQDFGFSSLRSPMLSLLLALALYLGSLLLWFRCWKAGGPRRFRLVLAPAWLVLAFALSGYAYFDRGGHVPDGILIASTVVDGTLWSEVAPVHSNVGLFATRHKDFSFSLDRDLTQLDLLPAPGGAAQPSLVLREGRPRNRLHLPLAEWQAALFRTRAVRPSPVVVDWERSRRTYRIGVANRGPDSLTECWLLMGGRAYRIGDLPPGGRLRREFPVPPGAGEAGDGEGLQPRDVRFDEGVRAALLWRSVFPGGEPEPGTAFLIGWIRAAEPEPRVDDPRVRTHHFKLLRVAIPLDAEEEEL